MGAIKTFTLTNNQALQTGGVTTQIVSSPSTPSTVDNTSISSKIVVNSTVNDKNVLNEKNQTLKDVVTSINAGQSISIPLTSNAKKTSGLADKSDQKSIVTNITGQTVKEQAQLQKSMLESMFGAAEHVDVSNEQFTTSEKITGLSQERPEVIQMMNYLPLFEKLVAASGYNSSDPKAQYQLGYESSADYNFTPAGEFFDAVYKQRLIKISNLNKTAKIFSIKSSLGNNDKFEDSVDDVASMLRVLFTLTQSAASLKNTLGIRDITCNFQKTFQLISKGELRATMDASDKDLNRYDNIMSPQALSPVVAAGSYTIPQMLGTLGFNLDVAKNVFSSTKLWFQTVYELRTVLKYSSDQLINASTHAQQVDVDPLVINRHSAASKRLCGRPLPGSFPSYNDVILLKALKDESSLNLFVQSLIDAHSTLNSHVSFDGNESKIAAMTNFLAQEYKYSYALKQQDFKNILQREYGYSVIVPDNAGKNNVEFIDVVLGKIPSHVTDIVNGNSESSLAAICQLTRTTANGQEAVLPLESRYLQSENSTFTPGGVALVDESLKTDNGQDFDTKSLQSYYDRVTNVLRNFIPVTLACDMYSFDSLNIVANKSNENELDTALDKHVLGDARNLFANLLRMLVGDNVNENNYSDGIDTSFDGFGWSGLENDPMWSLFSYAAKNPRALALLFVVVSSRIASSPGVWFNLSDGESIPTSTDRRSIIDSFLNQVENDYLTSTNSSEKQNFGSSKMGISKQKMNLNLPGTTYDNNVNEDHVRAQLTNGKLVDFVAMIMINLGRIHGRLVDTATRTQYSGVPGVVFNFLIFELICNLIDGFGNVHLKQISSSDSFSKKRTFHYVVRNPVSDTSITNIYSRLDAERSRTQGILLATTSVLADIGFATKMYLSTLTPNVKSTVGAVNPYATLGSQVLRKVNDLLRSANYVNLLMNEQQLMTSLNGVYDIATQVQRAKNADVAYAIIDDAADDPNNTVLLDTLYSVFSDKAFQSYAGYNKKILTVGLPTGFTYNFKQRRSSAVKSKNDNNSLEFTSKVNDVIRLVVRKIDIQHNELVFKPMSFLFDLSRYPARSGRLIKNDKNVTLATLPMFVGTRDYGNSDIFNVPSVEYYSQLPSITDANVKSTNPYPFLTNDQRASLYRNHVLSYLLEVYVRMMTGLNVSENAFTYRTTLAPVSTPELSSNALQAVTSAVTSALQQKVGTSKTSMLPGFGKKKSSAPQSGESKSTESTLSLMNSAMKYTAGADAMLEVCKNVAMYTNTFSTKSNDVYAKQRMLLPKQFDRVFSIVVDPDDFEIDVIETIKSQSGKQTLESMIQQGELEEKATQTPEKQGINVTSTYVSRQRTASDVAFEKYIVNVESFDDDGV